MSNRRAKSVFIYPINAKIVNLFYIPVSVIQFSNILLKKWMKVKIN